MDTRRALALSNVKFILNQPSVALAFLQGGRAKAYKVALEKLLKNLSKCDTDGIKGLLEESIATSSASFPRQALFYKSGSEFTSAVMLYYIIRLEKPQMIVETGVWSGKTSWVILQALSDNGVGKLLSIDLGVKRFGNSILPSKEIGGFVPQGLRSCWTLEIGDAKQLLPKSLDKLGTIDMFYHDSDHSYEHMKYEFRTVHQYMEKNGIFCSDDISMNNAWKEFSSSLNDHYEIDNRFGYGHK